MNRIKNEGLPREGSLGKKREKGNNQRNNRGIRRRRDGSCVRKSQ